MTNEEMQKRIIAVLQNLDELSRTGMMELKGIPAVQKMAGCAGVMQEILNALEQGAAEDREKESSRKTEREENNS